MAFYEFRSTWRLRAPIDATWDVIADWRAYPTWWRGVAAAEQIRPASHAQGAVGRLIWQAPLGYRLVVDMRETLVRKPTDYSALASGDLAGVGQWQLSHLEGTTTVRFTWRVHTTRPWLNTLGPILRPVLVWNHDQIMEAGQRGLARRLNAPVVDDVHDDDDPRRSRRASAGPLPGPTGLAGRALRILAALGGAAAPANPHAP